MDKKEIRRRFKERPPDRGIYQVKNLVDGRVYIGRAMDLQGKLNSERFQLRNNLHANRALQKDFADLGEEKFSFATLDRLEPKAGPPHDHGQELKELEEIWLDKLQPYDEKGYHKRK